MRIDDVALVTHGVIRIIIIIIIIRIPTNSRTKYGETKQISIIIMIKI